jgi:hypothetical protein
MNLIVGKQYKVTENHPFHPGRIGVFEFMGGPNRDAVVLCDVAASTTYYKTMFAVGKDEIEGEP